MNCEASVLSNEKSVIIVIQLMFRNSEMLLMKLLSFGLGSAELKLNNKWFLCRLSFENQHSQKKVLSHHPTGFYSRQVEEISILTTKEEADHILSTMNSLADKIQFNIGHPNLSNTDALKKVAGLHQHRRQ